MAEGHVELDAAANEPALLAAEAEGRAAFAIDAEGERVWAGEAASRLIGAGEFDEPTRRTLSRMASARNGGLLRLKLDGAPAPLRFRAWPIALDDAGLLALEALSKARPAADSAAEPLAAPAIADVAAAEGATETAEPQPAAEAVEAAASAIEPPSEPTPEGPFEAEAEAEPDAEPEPVAAEARSSEPDAAVSPDDDLPPDPRRDLKGARDAVASGGAASEALPCEAVRSDVADAPSPAPAREEPLEPFRFAFEIDERSRLTFLSPEFSAALGEAAAQAALGRTWNDLSAELALDPAGAVSAALERHGSWSDLPVSWPMADGRRAPLSLSALPMFDRGRSFVGFRGLGRSTGAPAPAVLDVDPAGREGGPAAEAPSVADPASGEPAPAAQTPEGQASEARTPEAEAADAATPEAGSSEPRYEPPALIETPPPAQAFSGNVVRLRETEPVLPPLPALSLSEVSAFDEIARRLQGLGRFDGASQAEEAPGPDAEEPVAPIFEERRRQPAGGEELLRLIDRLPVGALVLRGGEIVHASRAALDMLGCREVEDLSGRGPDTLFAEALPQDREAPAGKMRLIAASGGEVEVDARLSTIAWGGAPATLVTLRRAEAPGPAARGGDLQDRDIAAVLDVVADGVMTLDGAGRILSVNRGAEAMFGFQDHEVVGSLFTLSLAPESRRAAFDALDRLKLDGAAHESGVEVLGLSRNGGALPLLLTLGRVGGAEGDLFCALLRDIGPWKRAEEELIAARRQAERANAQKSDFLAKVGHEIRTPLNAIIGFAEVMMEERFGPVGSPRYKDYLKDIRASGDHLVKMVDDLLDISRIETGKLKLDFGPVDLNEIASQAAALLQPQANRERVIIRTSLARGLPPVLADRRSVRQILTNLAANAVKLSRPGGQVIVATALTDVGQAVFRVRDAGAGMSKQEIARAFEPFRPLAVADNDSGFSLGLPLTRALAEANEAVLALQSELGHGTLAEVTFPASRVLAS